MHGAILAPMADATTNPTTASGPRLDASSLEDASAFVRAAGLILDEVTSSRVTGHLELGPDHRTPWGIVHGGVYSTAVESAESLGARNALRGRGGSWSKPRPSTRAAPINCGASISPTRRAGSSRTVRFASKTWPGSPEHG